MENIYIPLSVIPKDADENDPTVPRRNPLEFLAPGTRHVVLGDPGSGKTTLLKFPSPSLGSPAAAATLLEQGARQERSLRIR